MTIRELGPGALDAARALLIAALPHDRIDVVAAEKLFGDNGARSRRRARRVRTATRSSASWPRPAAGSSSSPSTSATDGRGIASELLARAEGERLRVMDHPGNYLSPGLDGRYHDARAFFAARGFRELGVVENIRAPLDNRCVRST